ncbi:Beta-galactosidase 6 [Perkinsus chesapeaki]|uniref:Beta-galactosidase n=1 Tax=Perkinsus chesapeaki TaxID=330153 RepID=A0A7J6MMI0_PERCH|nr:Beta-galactosidase 6 [Perkinsus chesapeaki]
MVTSLFWPVVYVASVMEAIACAKLGSVGAPQQLVRYSQVKGRPYVVSYDSRAFLIDDNRTLLLGGSVHYPRLAPEEWGPILKNMALDGLNHVQIYVFWNVHEPNPPKYDAASKTYAHSYDLGGRADLVKFIKLAGENDLFVNVRIGPYVCAEFTFGGIPVWTKDIPGMCYRSICGWHSGAPETCEPWKTGTTAGCDPWRQQMADFTLFIVDLINKNDLSAEQGGPVIMAQIENEYHYHEPVGDAYIAWCGDLATNSTLNVPWVMCNGMSAKGTLNVCNDDDCEDFVGWHDSQWPNEPLGWTEDEGWFITWDPYYYLANYNRPPEEMAYVVAKWVAIGGSHHNYYMWYGGNHIGQWGAASLTNAYAQGVNVLPSGLPHEPKKSHLAKLHKVLGALNGELMSVVDRKTIKPQNLTGGVKIYQWTDTLGFLHRPACQGYPEYITFKGIKYMISCQEVLIVNPQSGTVYYASAQVPAGGSIVNNVIATLDTVSSAPEKFSKGMGIRNSSYPIDQLSITGLDTDYVLYMTSFISPSKVPLELAIKSSWSQAFYISIDGGRSFPTTLLNIDKGSYEWVAKATLTGIEAGQRYALHILSESLGIENGNVESGLASMEPALNKGIFGDVTVGGRSIYEGEWTMVKGLDGEVSNGTEPFDTAGTAVGATSANVPTWFYSEFDLPPAKPSDWGVRSVSLRIPKGLPNNAGGHIWLNGKNIGRWRATFQPRTGDYVQPEYRLPADALFIGKNKLAVFSATGDWVSSAIRPAEIIESFYVPELVRYSQVKGRPYVVSYDSRAFLIDNNRTLLLGGSVHYPRLAPEEWGPILKNMALDGLNHVQIYVFWNVHEPNPPKYDAASKTYAHSYDLSGRADLVKFIKLAGENDLFVNVRIGPYVCAEFTFGGIPVWTKDIPGMCYRSICGWHSGSPEICEPWKTGTTAGCDPWRQQMADFTLFIVDLINKNDLSAEQGGPVIMAQIENEYNNHEPVGNAYIAWCGDLATNSTLNVPWVMCNGMSAKGTLNVCNAYDCEGYAKQHDKEWPDQPLGWTEDEGWFVTWDPANTHIYDRSPEEMAYVVAKWVAIGGSHHNYYMWYGGNHIGQWGAASLTNAYAQGVNVLPSGLPHEPKKSHLAKLHKVLGALNGELMSVADRKTIKPQSLDKGIQLYQWTPNLGFLHRPTCSDQPAVVTLNGTSYTVSCQEVLIINPQSGTVYYASAQVPAGGSIVNNVIATLDSVSSAPEKFSRGMGTRNSSYPIDQLSIAGLDTDYVLYTTSFISPSDNYVDLKIGSGGSQAFYISFDGGKSFPASTMNIIKGTYQWTATASLKGVKVGQRYALHILSESLGIENYGNMKACLDKGIMSDVTVGGKSIYKGEWTMVKGLDGEVSNGTEPFDTAGTAVGATSANVPTWFYSEFDLPPAKPSDWGVRSVSLRIPKGLPNNAGGHIWLNGKNIGRWRATFQPRTGDYVQPEYRLPADALFIGKNKLAVFSATGDWVSSAIRPAEIIESFYVPVRHVEHH